MLRSRLLTACVIIPPLGVVLYIGGWLLTAGTIAAFAWCSYEFFCFSRAGDQRQSVQYSLCSLLPSLILVCYGSQAACVGLVIGMMLLLIINIASIESRPHQPIVENTVPAAVLGYAYFSLFCLPFVGVSLLSNGNLLLTWLIIVVAMTDSAAYFCGRFFGKTKMSPRISPNKTVVGALGGLGGALLVAYFAGVWLLPSLGAYNLVGVGFWVGVLSIIGDLVVSLMKRIYGAKDSGDLLPGHGGLLDRMDGMIFASPALYLFLVLSNV